MKHETPCTNSCCAKYASITVHFPKEIIEAGFRKELEAAPLRELDAWAKANDYGKRIGPIVWTEFEPLRPGDEVWWIRAAYEKYRRDPEVEKDRALGYTENLGRQGGEIWPR
jgi:hypothetical protein